MCYDSRMKRYVKNEAGDWVPASPEPFEFDGTVWQSPATLHGEFYVYREWYAHGATLFDWVAEDASTGDAARFSSKKDAVGFAVSETSHYFTEER